MVIGESEYRILTKSDDEHRLHMIMVFCFMVITPKWY